MNAGDADRVFARVQRRFARTPCRECSSRNTDAVVYLDIVIVSCSDCGGGTAKACLKRQASPN